MFLYSLFSVYLLSNTIDKVSFYSSILNDLDHGLTGSGSIVYSLSDVAAPPPPPFSVLHTLFVTVHFAKLTQNWNAMFLIINWP